MYNRFVYICTLTWYVNWIVKYKMGVCSHLIIFKKRQKTSIEIIEEKNFNYSDLEMTTYYSIF